MVNGHTKSKTSTDFDLNFFYNIFLHDSGLLACARLLEASKLHDHDVNVSSVNLLNISSDSVNRDFISNESTK